VVVERFDVMPVLDTDVIDDDTGVTNGNDVGVATGNSSVVANGNESGVAIGNDTGNVTADAGCNRCSKQTPAAASCN